MNPKVSLIVVCLSVYLNSILISLCDEFLKYSIVNVKNPAHHLHFSYGHTHSSITLSFTLNHSYHFIHDFTVFSIYLLNFNFF